MSNNYREYKVDSSGSDTEGFFGENEIEEAEELMKITGSCGKADLSTLLTHPGVFFDVLVLGLELESVFLKDLLPKVQKIQFTPRSHFLLEKELNYSDLIDSFTKW